IILTNGFHLSNSCSTASAEIKATARAAAGTGRRSPSWSAPTSRTSPTAWSGKKATARGSKSTQAGSRLAQTRYAAARADAAGTRGARGRPPPGTDALRRRTVRRGGQEVVALEGPDSRYRLPKSGDRMLTAYDRALAWGYVNEQHPNDLPSFAQLKQALIEHGPLAMPIA